MGTTVRIALYAGTAAAAEAAAAAAFARIAELDARLSDYRETSELMALCRSAGGPPVRVSADLFTVLAAAQRFAAVTGGAFDVTAGPVTRVWRRARALGEPPTSQQLSAARRLVGHTRLLLFDETRSVRLTARGMLLDLGGIAKGYAAGQAQRVLAAHGAPSALVGIGGDVVAGEPPPGRTGWQVTILPFGTAGPQDRQLTLERAAVSTSGDAEQYLERDGIRFSHILEPRTGRALTGRTGATVIAPDGMAADALATSLVVLGAERGLPLIDETPGASALIVRNTAHGPRAHASRRWPGPVPPSVN